MTDSVLERRSIVGTLAGKRIDLVGLQATITDVLVRVALHDGTLATTLVRPSRPWVEITAASGAVAVAGAYVTHGVEHILFGFDHLLFVLALFLIVRSRRVLLWTITAFTFAHSLTLGLATLGVVHVPGPPVEAAIALSILLLAIKIVYLQRGNIGLTVRWPWVVAFSFGLLHGFGFASALSDIGLPRAEIPLALFAFSVGVECGQLAFVAVVLGIHRDRSPRVSRQRAAARPARGAIRHRHARRLLALRPALAVLLIGRALARSLPPASAEPPVRPATALGTPPSAFDTCSRFPARAASSLIRSRQQSSRTALTFGLEQTSRSAGLLPKEARRSDSRSLNADEAPAPRASAGTRHKLRPKWASRRDASEPAR